MRHPDILGLVQFYTADKKYQELGTVSHASGYPDQLLSPVMKVWAFFRHFDEFIHGPEFSVDEVIACLQHSGPEVLDLIHDLHIALLYLFIDEFESVDKSDANRHKRTVCFTQAPSCTS